LVSLKITNFGEEQFILSIALEVPNRRLDRQQGG